MHHMVQGTKKVAFDSLGLLDFAIRIPNSLVFLVSGGIKITEEL